LDDDIEMVNLEDVVGNEEESKSSTHDLQDSPYGLPEEEDSGDDVFGGLHAKDIFGSLQPCRTAIAPSLTCTR